MDHIFLENIFLIKLKHLFIKPNNVLGLGLTALLVHIYNKNVPCSYSRDQGRVVSSGAGREDFLLDAFQAELLRCLASLQEATKLGIQCITLEVYAALVQEAI